MLARKALLARLASSAASRAARRASSASRRSVMSSCTPTHSRTAPSVPSTGRARIGADPVGAVVAPDALLEAVGPALFDRRRPGRQRRREVVRVDRRRPAQPRAFGLGLPREAPPVDLGALHAAGRVRGPDDVAHRLGGGAEPLLAGVERAADALLVECRGEHAQEQDREGRARDVEREVLLAEPDAPDGDRGHAPAPVHLLGEGGGRHAGVVHAGDGEAHDAGRHGLLPDVVLPRRQPQGRGRGRDGDEHRQRHDGRAEGEVARDLHGEPCRCSAWRRRRRPSPAR